jgi:hypothetical protein
VKPKDPKSQHVSDDQLAIFSRLFRGRTDVYGTYDFATKRSWQVKQSVTVEVVRQHLEGVRPLGVYPLVGEIVFFAATDFDVPDTQAVSRFLAAVGARKWTALVERTKSKGFHCWFFFGKDGAPAAAVRQILRNALCEVGQPHVEVFPKQDRLAAGEFGNFINLPLFGRLVPEGRTVFVDQTFHPYRDQWRQLEIVPIATVATPGPFEGEPCRPLAPSAPGVPSENVHEYQKYTWGLPPCSQRMLQHGVTSFQRVACFRLAAALRMAGVPFAATHAILQPWSQRNRPSDGRRALLPSEVTELVKGAYKRRQYFSYGCDDPAVQPHCSPDCRLFRRNYHAA